MRRLYWRDQYQSPREPFLKMRIPIIALLEKHILPRSGWMSKCSLFCPISTIACGIVSYEFGWHLHMLGIVTRPESFRGQRKRCVCPNTFHSLRATATTVLHAAGADHALAREIVGHDSEISHQLHIRPSDDQRKEAMEKLSEMIVPWHAVKIPLRWRSVILSLFVPSVSVP